LLQCSKYLFQGFVPANWYILVTLSFFVQWCIQSAQSFQFSRSDLFEISDSVILKEGFRYRLLNVSQLGLDTFLAYFRKTGDFIGHPAFLPAHAQCAGFTGVS